MAPILLTRVINMVVSLRKENTIAAPLLAGRGTACLYVTFERIICPVAEGLA